METRVGKLQKVIDLKRGGIVEECSGGREMIEAIQLASCALGGVCRLSGSPAGTRNGGRCAEIGD